MTEFHPDDFEYDFWKGAELRAGWDDLVPGEIVASHPITMTKDIIQRYARSIGDLNPLYFDQSTRRLRGSVVSSHRRASTHYSCLPAQPTSISCAHRAPSIWARTGGSISRSAPVIRSP